MIRIRSLIVGAAVFAVGASLVGAEITHAQLGAGGPPIGRGDPGQVADPMANIESPGERTGNLRSGPPSGPFQPRMPLTTLEEVPLQNLKGSGDLRGVGVPGSTADPSSPETEGQAYGDYGDQWPYSTARVAVTGDPGVSNVTRQIPVTSRPFRFTGKLYMRFGSSWYVCTASLIKRGVLVTAAHCVYDQARNAHADEVIWYPANAGEAAAGGGAYGGYHALTWYVPTAYTQKTDTCAISSVRCNNDVATVVLHAKNNGQAGTHLGGWYNYSWNGFGFAMSSWFGSVAAITQLGYPQAFDHGLQMQRNDSFGEYTTQTSNTTTGGELRNVLLGSAMTGGSSGGPWLVNFGTRPEITSPGEATLGNESDSNYVMGVTSWGFIDHTLNVQGASWFGQNYEFPAANYGDHGAGNIGALVNVACTAYPGRCQ